MKSYNKNSVLSVNAMILIAFIWGTSYIVIKDALRDIPPLTLMALRFSLAAILLGAIFYKKLALIKKSDFYHGAVIGIFLFLSFLTFIVGIKYTTVSKQSFLIASFVLIVPFLSRIFNKSTLDIYSVLGALLATFGIGLLTINSSLSFNAGDLLSLLSAIFFACHMVAIEFFNKDTDAIIISITQFMTAALLFILLALALEPINLALKPRGALSLIYLVVVATVIAFAVQNIAQKHISSTSTALILTLEPVFGTIFAIIILKEALTIQMVLGCIIIFFSIILQETKLILFKKLKSKFLSYYIGRRLIIKESKNTYEQ